LPRQHKCERHAQHGDGMAKQDKTLPMQKKGLYFRPENAASAAI
jgi:hypothetical protein